VWRRLVAVFLLAALGLIAETPPRPRASRLRWWLSVAALSAATALDVHTSWGRPEFNSFLRSPGGRFGARGLVIKSSILGASCGLQWLLVEQRPRTVNTLTGVNVGLASWSAGVAARNLKN